MTPTTLRLRDHLAREWRHAPRRAPLVMALVGVIAVAFDHLLLPRFPAAVLDFMRLGFRLDDLTGVIVLNDLMAIYFLTFFVGLTGSLAVVLGAREERRLELLLAKPIPAGVFVAARALPILALTAAVGVTVSAASAAAVALQPQHGASVTATGALGAGLALTALAVVLIAGLQLPFVRLRDPFTGLLVATLAWLATVMPTAVLLYRPDVFTGSDVLLALTLPGLLWRSATIASLGPLLLLAALPLAALLTRAAGGLLARSDAM